jgi:hypothetical protein
LIEIMRCAGRHIQIDDGRDRVISLRNPHQGGGRLNDA